MKLWLYLEPDFSDDFCLSKKEPHWQPGPSGGYWLEKDEIQACGDASLILRSIIGTENMPTTMEDLYRIELTGKVIDKWEWVE